MNSLISNSGAVTSPAVVHRDPARCDSPALCGSTAIRRPAAAYRQFAHAVLRRCNAKISLRHYAGNRAGTPGLWHACPSVIGCPINRSSRRSILAAAPPREVRASKGKRGGRHSQGKEQHQQQQGRRHQQQSQEPLGDQDYDYDDEEEENFLASFMDAVIKVECMHTEPNFSLPWQRKRQYPSSSTAFVIENQGKLCLLTNAHSVDYYTQVKVKRRGDDQKFIAKVLHLGVDCDIAMLSVEDPNFWEGLVPLSFGPLPRLQDTVAVVGYPVGGDTISVTAGVVSRIEVTEYSHGSQDLLGIQIDAAINSGNSGGPVFNRHGECVGIAFQNLSGSDVENVGYVIPTSVVQHFLQDVTVHAEFTGFPALGIQWQRMENAVLRHAYNMKPQQKGVLIRKVNPTSFAAGLVQPDDVLMAFDGQSIACDGTVPFRTGERISFSYLISNKFVGDSAALTLLRGGKELKVDVKLSKPALLVPPHLSNQDPSYFLVSGLVFTTANEPYLESEYGPEYASEAPVKLLEKLYHGSPTTPDEQVVLLGQVLSEDTTLGYEDVYNVQVKKFNGTPIRNLAHLAQLVMADSSTYLRFDCEYEEAIVVERAAAVAGTTAVMKAHCIPAAMSKDLATQLATTWPPQQESSSREAVAAATLAQQQQPVAASA